MYVDLKLHYYVYVLHYGVLCTIWWPSVRYRRRYQLIGGGEEAYISAAHRLMEETFASLSQNVYHVCMQCCINY